MAFDDKQKREEKTRERSTEYKLMGIECFIKEFSGGKVHAEIFRDQYANYLSEVKHQASEKKMQEEFEKKKTAEFVRKLIEEDKRAVDMERSKSREEKRRQRDFQEMVWVQYQTAKQADIEKRKTECMKDWDEMRWREENLDRNIREHSQKRRVSSINDRFWRNR
jgi:uncharacterized protein YktA (UPF0223 family)